MNRCQFVGLLLVGAAAAMAEPPRGHAQEPSRTYHLGFVIPSGRDAPPIMVFFDELRRNGFIEGQNLSVVPGGFNVRDDQVAGVAEALVKAAPDVIVSSGVPTRILQRASRTIPIIAMSEDMLADGLVASLARPEGNTSGISILSPELDGKRQDLLIEAVPGARHIAALADSKTITPRRVQELKDAARRRGVELSVIVIAEPDAIAPAIDGAKASAVEALNVLATPLFGSYATRRIVLDHAAALRLPAIYQWPDMAEEGGLMAYGPSFTDLYRQRARMVVKVLRGIKPADIPVEQPTRFELVINLRAAKAISHEMPAGLVLRADKVIE
jgi:putative ABC transport system substrate-binding protein